MTVKTHYDNLKVARNAPDDVIRAAYRSLIEKYHPSRNPSAEAARIAKILDEAFETLTDPVRRKNHDKWIAREELRSAMEKASTGVPSSQASRSFLKSITASFKDVADWLKVTAQMNGLGERLLLGMLLVGVVGYFAFRNPNESPNNDAPLTTQPYNSSPSPPKSIAPPVNIAPVVVPPLTQPYNPSPVVTLAPATVPVVPAKPVYQRPTRSPNGFPWPKTSSYIYPESATNGRSRVVVDNKRGNSDALVKIVSTDGPTASPVRVFYVTAHGEFTAHNLPPGTYDIRFCTLSDGTLWQSDSFKLKEIPDANGDGTTALGYELTLYTVPNGNMQMHPLNPADF